MAEEALTRPRELDDHFEDLEQQRETVNVGMWLFLASEVLFFGGMFAAYLVYRRAYPAGFQAASNELDWKLGTLNTAVLIGSSLSMALAVRAGHLGKGRAITGWIGVTIAMAVVFLVIKGFEYAHKFHAQLIPGESFVWRGTERADGELFFSLYFAMTGLHALHMLIGIVVLAVVAVRAWFGRYTSDNSFGVDATGLYWHFVDLIWIFLFPLLYLLGRHAG